MHRAIAIVLLRSHQRGSPMPVAPSLYLKGYRLAVERFGRLEGRKRPGELPRSESGRPERSVSPQSREPRQWPPRMQAHTNRPAHQDPFSCLPPCAPRIHRHPHRQSPAVASTLTVLRVFGGGNPPFTRPAGSVLADLGVVQPRGVGAIHSSHRQPIQLVT